MCIIAQTDKGSFDFMAASLREAAIPLRMTSYLPAGATSTFFFVLGFLAKSSGFF